MMTPDDIRAASRRIEGYVRRTPVLDLEPEIFATDMPVQLKLEFLQHTGSFKPRGAFNNLLSRPLPPGGIAAASGGNHGIATAYAARKLGVKATIFVPAISSPAKIAAIRALGADLRVGGERYADAQAACDNHAARTGALVIHPFDSWETMIGQGTLGMEWEQQFVEKPDTILVAAGGGGLVCGIAAWFQNRVKVVSVEPEGSQCLAAALEAGHPVDVTVNSIAADSLGARNCGERVHTIARQFLAGSVTVTDAAIRHAQLRAWQDLHLALEPGGATALAALESRAYRPQPGERVGVLLCGANVAPDAIVC